MNYEEILREIINCNREYYPSEDKAVFAKYFPELKESEDEKIKKTLIEYFKGIKSWNYFLGISKEQMIAWLEKQGENKSVDKPKFNVDDWITDGHLICKVLSVTGKSYELHLYNDDYCHFETDVQSVDKHYHLWTIKDAKEGNILVPKSPKEGGEQ